MGVALAPLSNAWAAQMDVFVAHDVQTIKPEFKFLRIMFIEYPQGGQVADNLAGKNEMILFTANSTQLESLIQKINSDLQKRSSSSYVTDVTLDYKATITGGEKQAAIEYRIDMFPTIENFEVRARGIDVARIIDSSWRGFEVDGSVVVNNQYGTFDVNSPGSALKVFSSDTYNLIQEANPDSIINQHIFDASGIHELPLHKWHFLFDPTAIIEESKKMGFSGTTVVSHYSLGECNIEVGPCSDRLWIEEVSIDKNYRIRIIESQDDATISIEGFVLEDNILGLEVFGINPEAPDTGNPATDEFPATVIYGMAGVAAVGGGAFFLISNRKLKGEQDQGQTGIDPSMLSAYPTSESAGGYRTNRGEAQLRNIQERRSAI